MTFARRAWAVAWKDVMVERRSKETVNAVLFFSVLLLFVFEFTLGADRERLAAVLPGLLWLGVLLAGLLGLGRSFVLERENDCWEALLLTPTRRRQIVVGKLLAALSPWPVALALTIPYLAVLGQGDEVLLPAIAWGAALGTVLCIAYTGTGLLVSFWSNTNRTSYLVSLGIYILILVPAQLPGRAQTGTAGQFLQQLNPLAAQNHFLSKILVNNRTFEEFGTWLLSPFIFATLVVMVLIGYSAPGLRLEAGRAGGALARRWGRLAARFTGMFVLAVALLVPAAVLAATTRPAHGDAAPLASEEAPVDISVDLGYATVNTGDPIFFDTVVTNPTQADSPPLIVAMNIINLDAAGDVVDPEDWSPQRTQYIDSLSAGKSVSLSLRVNAILDGDYLVYMTLIPEPA